MTDTLTNRRGFLKALSAGAVAAPLLIRAERLEAAFDRSLRTLAFDAADASAVRRLRAQYLLAPDLIYLNHASIGTVPRPVHEAHQGYLELCETHPSLYTWGRVWREVTEETRRAAARLVACDPDDLAITHNTTEGFNILAHGLPLGAGDEVLFSTLNHAAASVAWRSLAPSRGFTVRSFDFPVSRGEELDVNALVRLHAEAIGPSTRVLVLPHVDNLIGIRHPLRAIADAAHERGVEFVLVDAAQSAGMLPVDLAASGVDACAMSPHKWIQAPKGLGLFYATPALRSVLPRMWHRSVSDFDGSARMYEDYSTRAWPAVVALGDALAFQASIGEREKLRRYQALWRKVRDRADAEPGLAWRSPRDPALFSVIMAVEVMGANAPELGARLLQEHGVVVRAFGAPLNTLRISPNVMTTDGELDHFLDVIATVGA